MIRWQHVAGVAVGLAGAAALLSLAGGVKPPAAGPILSECDGHADELVIQYEPSAREMVTPVYRDFLGALDPDVMVHVLCPNEAAFQEIVAAVGRVRCKLMPIIANHAITTWARDRWVALTPASRRGATTLWSPLGEAGADVWPARVGDERVAGDIAGALGPSVLSRRSGLYFDGGDFLADSENVFVAPRVLQRNIQNTVHTREEMLGILGAELKRHVILLNEAPEHHLGMFMASIGNRTMLVGDPALAKELAPAATAGLSLPGGPDFTPETQHLFDAVAAQCAAAGYRVIRMPVIPACDGRTYLTYVNALLDRKDGRRIVFLPFYRGAEAMNAAAREIWRRAGYETRPVDCTTVYGHFGCLHCLVNVLRRSDTAAAIAATGAR
jgi:hypothetical protein